MLKAWGMSAEAAAHFADMADEPVWLENWQAVTVFDAMTTQWREGFGGRTGLDYTALPAVFSLLGVARRDRRPLFDKLRIMEDEALHCMRSRNG